MDDTTLISADQLQAQAASDQPRMVFDGSFDLIGSGVTAVPNILALEIARLGRQCLFAGSWREWCSDPARPVAKD